MPSFGDVDDDNIEAAIISFIKEKPLHFKPGTQFEYNNTGFILLGKIIEELSTEGNLSQFLENRIFNPLGMKNSKLPTITQERQQKPSHYVQRYTSDISNIYKAPTSVLHPHFTAPYRGAAAMISTMNDLLLWHEALYQGKLLSEASFQLMTSPYIEGDSPLCDAFSYGYGIFMTNNQIHEVIFKHGGWIEGIRTELHYNPKTMKSVIILSNLSPDEDQSEEMMAQQFKALHDMASELHKVEGAG